jgi:hypothetical protein
MKKINPTTMPQAYGDLFISRIIPGNGSIYIEWSYPRDLVRAGGEFIVQVAELETSNHISRHAAFLYHIDPDARTFETTGLSNGIDYTVTLTGYQNNVRVGQAPIRIVRPCPAPGITVAYCHPEDYTFDFSGRSLASPSILRLPNGRLLVSHDFYWACGGQNLSHVYYSDDDGFTWHFLSELKPCFWGKLFWHQNKLFMMAVSTEYGSLEIFSSNDMGKTWSGPIEILHGEGLRDKGGPHRAPTPVVEYSGRLWTAVEYGSWELPAFHDAGVASIALEADPMVASNWIIPPFVRYNPDCSGAVKGGHPGHLEGNVVITPDGELVNFMRYQTSSAEPDYGKAFIYRLDYRNPGVPLTFDRIVDFPGNMSKFDILRDPCNGLYVSLVNPVTLSWRGQRNILALSVSEDLYHWRLVKELINYQDNGWPEGYKLAGFQYVSFLIENGAIYYVSRTALGGANSYHDANRITFHKLENYKQYI